MISLGLFSHSSVASASLQLRRYEGTEIIYCCCCSSSCCLWRLTTISLHRVSRASQLRKNTTEKLDTVKKICGPTFKLLPAPLSEFIANDVRMHVKWRRLSWDSQSLKQFAILRRGRHSWEDIVVITGSASSTGPGRAATTSARYTPTDRPRSEFVTTRICVFFDSLCKCKLSITQRSEICTRP